MINVIHAYECVQSVEVIPIIPLVYYQKSL